MRKAPQERVGILSRTLSSGSSIQWILSARIRCPTKNDVVFVGSTYIQLHEYLNNGPLVVATAKLDFGVQITDAKVISAASTIATVPSQIKRQDWDDEEFTIRGEPVAKGQPPQILVVSTLDNELIYVYAREDSAGNVRLVFAKRSLLRGAGLPEGQCRLVAVDSEYESKHGVGYCG